MPLRDSDTYIDPLRFRAILNTESEMIPPRGLCEPCGIDGATGFTKVRKPTQGNLNALLVNGYAACEANSEGMACSDLYVPIAYSESADGNPPQFNEIWGPKAGSWLLHKEYAGYQVVNTVDPKKSRFVLVKPMRYHLVDFVRVDESLEASSTSATYYKAEVIVFNCQDKEWINTGVLCWFRTPDGGAPDAGQMSQAMLCGNFDSKPVYVCSQGSGEVIRWIRCTATGTSYGRLLRKDSGGYVDSSIDVRLYPIGSEAEGLVAARFVKDHRYLATLNGTETDEFDAVYDKYYAEPHGYKLMDICVNVETQETIQECWEIPGWITNERESCDPPEEILGTEDGETQLVTENGDPLAI